MDMLLLLVAIFGVASAQRLTCHCLEATNCSSNGFCVNGCAKDWYGPGCQVGNVALNRIAEQSSTYSETGYNGNATLAVDGLVPNSPTDMSAKFCSHTESKQKLAWWYVTLSTTHNIFISKVTLVNRKDRTPSTNERLRNFVILYSNGTDGNPDPNDTNWHVCARQREAVKLNQTYTCSGTSIGKRVAVYLLYDDSPILTLCEVKIFGYQLDDCPSGFTGPGCLLRACDGQCNSALGTCGGEYNSCRYDICPDQSQQPPDCWITLSNYSAVKIQSNVTCNTAILSGEITDSHPNIAASTLLLHVSDSSNHITLVNTTQIVPENKTMYYVYRNAPAGATLEVSVRPLYCDATKRRCFHSIGSQMFTSVIGKREYWLSNNNSCLYVHVNSSTYGCELPTAIQIQCQDNDGRVFTVNSSSDTACVLEEGHQYDCSVTATISTLPNDIESRNFTIGSSKKTWTATVPPEPNIGIVAGCIVGVLVVIVAIIVILVYIRRKNRSKAKVPGSGRGAAIVQNMPTVSTSDANTMDHEDEQTFYCNMSGMTLSQYQQYVQDNALITRKFSELQGNETHHCINGKAPENKGKNRFQNILPYDFNRVRLNRADNDYINASYINGLFQPKEYIATQGPSPKTVEDFWQMMWQENCSLIIMLTSYIEHVKRKCEKYFPLNKSPTADIEVAVRSTNIYDTHSVSVLDLRHDSEVRTVYHFHYLAWLDQSVPAHNAELLLFHNKIDRHLKSHPSQGPIIVHCSAGVGRTGTYLAFDYLLKRYQSERTIDVDNCVLKLRDQRMLMVQTKDQYTFLHSAVLYGITSSRYIYDVHQLSALAQPGASFDSRGIKDMASEWQELQACVPRYHASCYAASLQPENRRKNRRNEVLALDSKRPIILLPDGSNQLYINAVYCNGCYSNRQFIATQLPLKDTAADFWLMVYDCQPSYIIVLHDLSTDDDEDVPRYWPEPSGTITNEWFEIKSDLSLKGKTPIDAIMPVFNITLSPVSGTMTASQTVSTRLIATNLWDAKSSVELPANMINFASIALALRTCCFDTPEQPIIVQCSDGVTQCGLFLSATNALHRLIEAEHVSVFHTVDLLRSSRPEFVTSEDQYRFIYKFLETYLDSSNIYANA